MFSSNKPTLHECLFESWDRVYVFNIARKRVEYIMHDKNPSCYVEIEH